MKNIILLILYETALVVRVWMFNQPCQLLRYKLIKPTYAKRVYMHPYWLNVLPCKAIHKSDDIYNYALLASEALLLKMQKSPLTEFYLQLRLISAPMIQSPALNVQHSFHVAD